MGWTRAVTKRSPRLFAVDLHGKHDVDRLALAHAVERVVLVVHARREPIDASRDGEFHFQDAVRHQGVFLDFDPGVRPVARAGDGHPQEAVFVAEDFRRVIRSGMVCRRRFLVPGLFGLLRGGLVAHGVFQRGAGQQQ